MIIFVRNLVVKDFWLKLFAFALAVLIWLTVKFSIRGEGSFSSAIFGHTSGDITMTVPVRVSSTGNITLNLTPTEVEVTLHGDPRLLNTLRSDDVRAQVDMTGIASAQAARPVQIILPPGVSYTHLSPDEVQVSAVPKSQ